MNTVAWPNLSSKESMRGKPELILHNLFVEGPIIDAYTPSAILFKDKQNWRAVGTRTGSNKTPEPGGPSPAPPFHPAQLVQVGMVAD